MISLLKDFRQRYLRVDSEENTSAAVMVFSNHENSIQIGYQLAVCTILLAATAGALGLWLGQHTFLQLSVGATAIQGHAFDSDKHTLRTFNFSPAYTHAPSNETNKAWESLFPEGGGFLVDPMGIEGIGVSAFHQLHCLDLLRHLYYSTRQIISLDDERQEESLLHARHCFDYLRQAIMCAADSALELGSVTTKHITGAGAVHQCRDYDGLVRWTEERRHNPGQMKVPR